MKSMSQYLNTSSSKKAYYREHCGKLAGPAQCDAAENTVEQRNSNGAFFPNVIRRV